MIEVRDENGLRIVTINRPEKANSLTAAMLEDLLETFTDCQSVRALILTGTGASVFSAGADLAEAHAGLATSDLWEQVSGALSALPCLTIAALNGTLAGGAFGMALACDIRLCVPAAKFFYPVAKLGFLPQPSDPPRLVNLVGPARAKLILLAGQKLSAEEALSFGLVDRICAPDDLLLSARALCATALAADQANLHAIKTMIP
ncbi:enoyl-CoA hydratase/isomerase family protein [Gymnodinialimonas ceratoperidinii]|uniref:Enoyl-CoA hydratase/isomerase family protein n=1 Tax=Gymnodinialimonas ceratoperidinii TaxID=2856823 RepID=A0A8F6TVR2_9RHOB|nr:enoyl-CoA hydratase/isomerase family protein [Gymnodinialimonas ceratoperidinii]QXT39821.1 enoyl-CoA hydratase/isomerase family protein [Gymnodinialimonas ceratoperidinii]